MSAVLKPMPIADALADAIETYITAKRAEDAAREIRLAAEERILSLKPAKEEGSETFEAGGFKVTLTGKLTYSCPDPKALAEACAAAGWPANMVPIKTKTELDATGAKWLRANEPDAWRLLAQHIEIKPAKTAISVKV
jgi:hypothetical protein